MQEAVIRVREYRYMRSRMLTCLLVATLAAWGQNNRMSVEKLVAFVQSSEKIIKEEKTMTERKWLKCIIAPSNMLQNGCRAASE